MEVKITLKSLENKDFSWKSLENHTHFCKNLPLIRKDTLLEEVGKKTTELADRGLPGRQPLKQRWWCCWVCT